MISLIEQTNETDENQLQRLQDVYDITPFSLQKRKKVNLPTCLNTPTKLSKRVKEIPHGMVYYFILLCIKKDMSISLYFALDLLGPPSPFNLLPSIVSCPNPQCEGENKVLLNFV